MLKKDEGVVLKTARSGESSLVVTFLGRELGKVRLMAKGVLSPKSRARGLYEPCNHLEVVFYFGPGRTLFYVKEASVLSPPYTARDSLTHMAAGLAVAELLDQVCFAQSPDESVVDLAVEYARSDRGRDPLFLFLAFETKLLEALGALPQLSGCAVCGSPATGGVYNAGEGESYCKRHAAETQPRIRLSKNVLVVFNSCLEEPLSELSGREVAREVRKHLGKIVHWTYTYHVQGYSLPKSLSLI
jgi:DNA repair protein RecO (recombination protein O)